MNVIGYDAEFGEIICDAPISFSQQICSTCVMQGHRMTGLL